MQSREKLLAGVLAAVVGLWFAQPVFQAWFLDPLQALETRELGLTDQVADLQSKRLALAKSDKELRDWKAQSLPPDSLAAERLYQEWLNDLAELSGFRSIQVSKVSSRVESRNQFAAIVMQVKGTGTLAQLQQFVARFQEVSLLHRISSCDARSSDNEGDPLLNLTIQLEGLSLPDAQPRKRLFPETALKAPLSAQENILTVTDAADFPKTVPFRARLDREFVQVTAMNGSEWTLQRAQAGTYAAEHPAATSVELVPLKDDIQPSRLLTATSLFAKPSPPVVYTPKFTIGPPPVIRGTPWTWKPELSGWNPAEPDPVYKLQASPEGMTVDAATGTLSWSPAESVAVGPYEAELVALSGGQVRATAKIPLRLRLPNNRPKIEPISQLTFYFGRESTARVAFSDADLPAQQLTFSLDGAPQGMLIDARTGVIRWLPPDTLEPQSLSVTVKVTDNDELPMSDSISVPIKIEEDAAKYTRLTGIIDSSGKREAWLLNIAVNEQTTASIGDQVKVADIEFRVLDIQRDKIIVDRDGKPFRPELGSFVVALAPAAADEVPSAAPPVSPAVPPAGTPPTPQPLPSGRPVAPEAAPSATPSATAPSAASPSDNTPAAP